MKRTLLAGLVIGAVVGLGLLGGCRRSADKVEEEPPIDVPAEDLKALVEGNNAFAIDLYKKIAEKEKGNICISPYSISSALAMTYAGARGETAEEMKKALHFTLPPEKLHPAFGGLTESLQTAGKNRPYQLNIANALWAQHGLNLLPEFRELTGKSYGAGVREVDFGQSELARGTINSWVEEETKDHIKELLKAGDLDPDDKLVLANAIYFKGEWKRQFNVAQTRDGEFETEPGKKVNVRMMQHSGDSTVKFRTYGTQSWQILELPYRGDRLTMVVMLPTKRCGLREVEKNLTWVGLELGFARLAESDLEVRMPKFKCKTQFGLRKLLVGMGMARAFQELADFSNMSTANGLKIKDVIHGGAIDVDEAGSVAAATTAVIITSQSAPPMFQVDHPFMCMIRDTRSGAILFLGRVGEPR